MSNFASTFNTIMGEQANDIAQLLARLHEVSGAEYARLVEQIARRGEFHPLSGEADIFITGGQQHEDFANLLAAARKAVEHGYRVFVLPNPKGIRTADFILEKKAVYKLYDLKTIQGKASVSSRLLESIGQANRILLNMATDYSARLLASDIKLYFETNPKAIEILIFKGKKIIVVSRRLTTNKMFNRLFRKMFEQ